MFVSTFYNIVVEPLLESAFRIGALWNEKARKAVNGRADWEKKLASQLEKSATQKVMLFHAPSVGEFLQGRAVIERLINRHPRCWRGRDPFLAVCGEHCLIIQASHCSQLSAFRFP